MLKTAIYNCTVFEEEKKKERLQVVVELKRKGTKLNSKDCKEIESIVLQLEKWADEESEKEIPDVTWVYRFSDMAENLEIAYKIAIDDEDEF